ncbi:hypothetical protein L873DRAFT_1327274 [Choiromyces venosus 120613-1]|uniref:Uncharacterized protein n=1 Tax=Choiromyces venosus 120613-1 TaxID=1336337 RepID=A0A3N4JAP6_9PEZI|nr:hypothetical protein L873DRAFT_1327274 [Choiromyces venosus 120613-1]
MVPTFFPSPSFHLVFKLRPLPLDPVFSQQNIYLPIFLPQPITVTSPLTGEGRKKLRITPRRPVTKWETSALETSAFAKEKLKQRNCKMELRAQRGTSHVPTTVTRGTRTTKRRGGPGVPGRSEAAIEAMIGGRGTKNAERARG